MRNYTLYNIGKVIRLLTLAICLSFSCSNLSWGQYTINYKDNKRQENIPEFEQIVYVNGTKELAVPELKYCDGYDDVGNWGWSQPGYRWYVRWYVLDEDGDMVDITGENPILQGIGNSGNQDQAGAEGSVLQRNNYNNTLKTAKVNGETSTTSLFWYSEFFRNNDLQNTSPAGAAIVEYTHDDNDGNIVYCDISLNLDYRTNNQTITEPTLSKRYKFVIKQASDIKAQIDDLKPGEYLQDDTLMVPNNATGVNVLMKHTPDNYFWGNNNNQGATFRIGNGEGTNKQIVKVEGTIDEEKTVIVSVLTSNRRNSKDIARFTLVPYEKAEVTEYNTGQIDPNDTEERHIALIRKDLYKEIGVVDFDRGSVVNEISATNNICSDAPIDATQTSYAFYYTDKAVINKYWTPVQNQYGLYRSANYEGASMDGSGRNGARYTINEEEKGYRWFYSGNSGNKTVYDRTYYNRAVLGEETGHGYFCYIDASAQPGRIVNIKLDGIVCSNTELLVTAWVNNMTGSTGETKPNININLIGFTGENDADGKILHRYTSGEIAGALGNWNQITYPITLSAEKLQGLTSFRVEIQNNTPTTSGADYAMDDIRIYRRLPDVHVGREDACDASTLVVRSDYQTLMRNMGWNLSPDNVIDVDKLSLPHYRKYRYGLMGNDPHAELDDVAHLNFGNIYFGFVTDTAQRADGTYPDGTDPNTWVTVNKMLEKNEELTKLGLHKNIRVVVPANLMKDSETKESLFTKADDAFHSEIIMNIRAINDFIADTKTDSKDPKRPYWKDDRAIALAGDLSQKIQAFCTRNEATDIVSDFKDDEIFNARKDFNPSNPDPNNLYYQYEQCLEELYAYLKIPRVRCPWRDDFPNGAENTNIYLSQIDVYNTDLRFMHEIYQNENGDITTANGRYYVVLFRAEEVAGANQGDETTDDDVIASVVNLKDPCTLIASFYVAPSIRIRVDTESNTNGVTCVGALHTMEAGLVAPQYDQYGNIIDDKLTDFTEQFEGTEYTFDWYLDSLKVYTEIEISGNYNPEVSDLKDLIQLLRNTSNNTTAPLTINLVNSNQRLTNEDKELLITLLEEGKLISGKKVSFPLVGAIVAMPYIQGSYDDREKLFCTKIQEVELKAELDVPGLSVGFSNVIYGDLTDIPLRLGLPNIKNSGNIANIPIQDGNKVIFGKKDTDGEYMGAVLRPLLNDSKIYLDQGIEFGENRYLPVATLTGLNAVKDPTEDEINYLSLSFNDNAANHFQEGQEYTLMIPFGEYANADALNPIEGSCEGYATLKIKIVPEYLTWKGEADGVWYNDNNWNQSTKAELYMGDKSNEDANGSDPITNAFSPLYFTKVTIAPGENGANGELKLDKAEYNDANGGLLEIKEDIKYDMAVNTDKDGALKVEPYYINKVNEIYFKPEATLMNQHFLSYDTARVEFTLTKSTPYWMASPLKAVYAGDMYAPHATGKEESPAFDFISFDYGTNEDGINHRWQLPFYQKAWNKAVAYSNVGNPYEGSPSDGDVTDVTAVKSNWSIEYNDVWVPYTIGKGFYIKVEGKDATVRLPKADKEYTYQATKALSDKPQFDEDTPRSEAGQLAAYNPTENNNGEVTIDLTKVNGETADDVKDKENADKNKRHFLIGNPYMAYLNMDEFFKKNTNLSKKYWALREGTQTAIVGTPDVNWTGNETEGAEGSTITGYIAPMEAFFVELAEASTQAEDETTPVTMKVTFTPTMMAAQATATATASTPGTRSHSATAPMLTLTAERNGQKGRSVITLRDNADNTYQPQEDAVVLLDSELDAPVAYSVAGNRAAQVNALRSIDNIPVGVYNSCKGDVSLTIEGISQLAEPLYLYDSYTRSSTLLEGDSYTLDLSGESHGRYYLRSSATGSIDTNTITIYSVKNGKVIVSSTEEVRNIKVYSLNGTQIKEMNINTTQHTFNLPKGIYIVRAKGNADAVKTEKVMVR